MEKGGTSEMVDDLLHITYIGGPTARIEIDGLSLLTDPTFDAPGSVFRSGPVTLHKLIGPALAPESLGPIDAVLLSHDQHFDNFDRAGRIVSKNAGSVLTTPEAASRLERNARGLAAWQSTEITNRKGRILRVTGTPARHGPAGADRGPVTGFVIAFDDSPSSAVYVSGDSVWFEGMAEVARRFDIHTAILFMGAARVPEIGPQHLTLAAEEGVEAARAFSQATIVPLHFEGWAHFSESREKIAQTFASAGLAARLRWPEPGKAIRME
jgi:L-ascorbate metabolism protein UlaG (beta-lactamase superfamily)